LKDSMDFSFQSFSAVPHSLVGVDEVPSLS
jgi:hypothetical protein